MHSDSGIEAQIGSLLDRWFRKDRQPEQDFNSGLGGVCRLHFGSGFVVPAVPAVFQLPVDFHDRVIASMACVVEGLIAPRLSWRLGVAA